MPTREALVWQCISCVLESKLIESANLLHGLPQFHRRAPLDVTLNSAVCRGARGVITAAPMPDKLLPSVCERDSLCQMQP